MTTSALKRRLVPSAPFTLELQDDSGSTFTKNFRLSCDFNALALIEEKTGFSVLTGDIWQHINSKTLSVMVWAFALANHPEFDSDEGLIVVRSYLDPGNADKATEAVLDAYIASLPKDKQEKMRAAKEKATTPDPTSPETPTVQ